MDSSLLEDIGLTKSEVNVYLALLELGSSSTGKIVDKSGASSSKIYEILDRLMQKGLVSYVIKSRVKYFEAADPNRILDYVNEKESKLIKQKEKIKNLIPELELKRKISKYKSEATIYKGLKGVKTAFYDALNLLKPEDEMLVLGIPSRSEKLNRFFVKFAKDRAKRKIKAKSIFNEKARGELQTLSENSPLTEIKYINEITPASVNIFKNRVIIFPESKEILLIVIDSKEIAESFKVQFEKWWNQRSETYEGQEAVENVYNSLLNSIRPDDEVIIFAAKPTTKRAADFNLNWIGKISKKAKMARAMYYGYNDTNKTRALEFKEKGCKTKIIPTQQTLPVSTVVVGNNILEVVWGVKPITFKIENKNVAEYYKSNFNLLWDQEAVVLRGHENIERNFWNMLNELKEGDEYYVLGASWHGKKDKIPEFYKKFHEERQRRKIKAKFLFVSGTEDIVNKSIFLYQRFGEVKFLPQGIYEGIQVNLYNEKVIFQIWREKEPIVISIEDEKMYKTFKTYFDLLWNSK
ncbi:hypothetical protein HY500_03465 [Candidatus Woesearchaeota archaeon]|nr:hypothetical protein [Candidatus Woesearchaeota archaeon]